MELQKREGIPTRRTAKAVVAAVVAATTALSGCAADYVTGNEGPVSLYITAINEGRVLDSDVRLGETSSLICEDEIEVTVAVRNKNPNAPTPIVPSAVVLNAYEVRYFRSDGRGVEGVDVPYRITGNLTQAVDVSPNQNTGVVIEVVRRQAKLEPPLTTIFQTAVLTVMAEVTLYGNTVSGSRVSASGRFQIDFADFADNQSSCPTD